MAMRIVVDEKADALYVYFSDVRPARTVFIDDEHATLVDLGPDGELLGFEVIYLRRDWTDQLEQILTEYPIGETEAARLRVLAGPNHLGLFSTKGRVCVSAGGGKCRA